MTKRKFKIGDVVEIYNSDICKTSWVGKTGKIVELVDKNFEDEPGYRVENYHFVWFDRELRLVTPEHKPKFKIGDRVRVKEYSKIQTTNLPNNPAWCKSMSGHCEKEGKIVKFSSIDSIMLDFCGRWWHPDWLELIDEPKLKGQTAKVTIGDESSEITMTDVDNAIWDIKHSGVPGFSGTISLTHEAKNELMGLLMNKEEPKMELKNIKKENLKTAKANVAKERKNAEIEAAEMAYRVATDLVDEYDREIKDLEEAKKEHLEVIALFNKK